MPQSPPDSIARDFDPPYQCHAPVRWLCPLVFNSPHSGQNYPASFLAASDLDLASLRRSEDFFVDELFAHVTDQGAPLLAARFPRAYVDVNREAYELDPAMFSDPLPDFVNSTSIRVAGGLGTIARIVSENVEIYRDKLSFAEAEARINLLYRPYHEALRALMAQAFRHFGMAFLVDCHSMPSAVVHQFAGHVRGRADVILGDRYGSSCLPEITRCLEEGFAREGLVVLRNKPYAGGYITQSYGRPAQSVNAIQIEINRALYMNEATQKRDDLAFAELQRVLRAVTGRLGAEVSELAAVRPLAAE